MPKTAVVLLAPGAEELETVTIVDILVRGGVSLKTSLSFLFSCDTASYRDFWRRRRNYLLNPKQCALPASEMHFITKLINL